MYKIITTKGEIKETGKTITLENAQKAVGGYIERVKLPKGKWMLVDEEALIKSPRPELNRMACSMCGLTIFGDVVLLDKMSDLKG
jgi:hypothetical protein